MRTFGKMYYVQAHKQWIMEAEPHVRMRFKRIFRQVGESSMDIRLSDTMENATDLLWFMARYPLKISKKDLAYLHSRGEDHRSMTDSADRVMTPAYTPTARPLAEGVTLRQYQAKEVDLYLRVGGLLVADDVGLGKTITAIGAMTDARTLPAVVVCPTNLPRQWKEFINLFVPDLKVYVAKAGFNERSGRVAAGNDVIILSYSKLAGWAAFLSTFARSVTWDEAQELRCSDSLKATAARMLCAACNFRLGLSATPIYNYGEEMFNVLQCIRPGALGSREEFIREWCAWGGANGKSRVLDPKAFGTFLRERHLMVRHTRTEVGRELPELSRIPHTVSSDRAALERISDNAVELAKIILRRTDATVQQRYVASGEFDMLMRQATGIAKAPYVAQFARMIIETGEPIILAGWHREVYDVWASLLKDLNPCWYTGTESPNQKQKSKEAFLSGESKLMFMSLRSGVGMDGIQKTCRTVVFGELDWSPGVHDQCIGRVHRDGQESPVQAYYLISDEGSDPIIAQVLGVKRGQVEGIRDPNAPLVEQLSREGGDVKRLAETFLARRGHAD